MWRNSLAVAEAAEAANTSGIIIVMADGVIARAFGAVAHVAAREFIRSN